LSGRNWIPLYSKKISAKPLALQYVQENLKADEEVVNAAFGVDQTAIQFAHKSVVLKLLKKSPLALEYVQKDLKADESVVNAAFDADQKSIQFAHKSIVKKLLEKNPLALL